MVVGSRYSTGGDEADVTKNKLGITDLKVLGNAETVLLSDAYKHFFKLLHEAKLKLELKLLFEIHEYFLGHLYTWAGKIRTVNVIHPFREGNGRTLRLFLDLLTVNAGYEVVSFKKIPNKEFIEI